MHREKTITTMTGFGWLFLNLLAYAPEIAGAMLQRQQANAVVAARRMIVG